MWLLTTTRVIALWELCRELWLTPDIAAFQARCIYTPADDSYYLGDTQSFSMPDYLTLHQSGVLRLGWMRKENWNLGRLASA